MTRLFHGTLPIAIALAIASTDVAAQSLVCQTIRPGETASTVARRMTGRAENRAQPWFQIVDRGRRSIPKARYDHILAGWHACVSTARLRTSGPVAARPAVVAPAPVAAATRASVAPPIAQRPPRPAPSASRDPLADLALLGLWSAMLGVAIGLAWQSVEQFLRKRQAVTREMEGFGRVFLKDFEQPLRIDGVTTSPIRTRLRCAPGGRRLEIFVAPGAGRRYPNLDDHRQNVEYDVERITRRLDHPSFVRRSLRAEGPWVVIPFRLELNLRKRAVV